MHKIKDLMMQELYEYEEKASRMGGSAKLSTQDIEKIHKLTDTVKNIDKIEMLEEGGYSEDTDFMGEGRMYGTSYDGGSSYARGGGRGRGRNAKRDSMGRYSSEGGSYEGGMSSYRGSSYERGGQGVGRGGNRGGNNRGGYSREGGYSRDDAKDEMMDKLEDMMEMAETPKEREAIQHCMKSIERG